MITKAIIPVAGWGTRRLPITKAIEKCMLPVGNRPLVDFVVDDAVRAGITDIYFVVGEGSTQLQAYYGHNQKLNDYLQSKSKEKELALVQPPANVNFHYVTQPASGDYGTAVPIRLVADQIAAGESVVVLMGDDFIFNGDGSSEVARLIQATADGQCGLLAATVPIESVGRYGVIETDAEQHYIRIVDQPDPSQAPSNLINISKYVLTKDVIDRCMQLSPAANGEFQLPDAINHYVADGGVVTVVPAIGQYLDGGTVEGWLHANQVVAGLA